jgi:hypothetical protein
MNFYRNCPKCEKSIEYSIEKNFLSAIDKNTICTKCASNYALSCVKYNPQTDKRPKADLSGKIFGNWKVLDLSHREDKKSNHGIWYWNVQCTNCSIKLKRTTAYIKKSKGCIHCELRAKGETGLNKLWANYIESAKKRDIPFNLSKEQFKELTSSRCYYCGCLPKMIKFRKYKNKENYNWGDYQFNGIDRIDNNLGYIKGNCVPCCRTCNRGKGAWSFEYWVTHLQEFYKNAIAGEIECLRSIRLGNLDKEEVKIKRW